MSQVSSAKHAEGERARGYSQKKKLRTVDMRPPDIDVVCLTLFEVGMFERELGKGAW